MFQLAFEEVGLNLPYLEIFLEKKFLKNVYNFRVFKFHESLKSLNFALSDFSVEKSKI